MNSAPGIRSRRPGDRRVVDLRLVPAAVATWSTTLAGLLGGSLVAGVVGVVGMAAVAALCTTPALRPWLRANEWAPGVLAVLTVSAVAGGALCLRLHQVEQHPLRAAAEHGARVTLTVSPREAPKPLHGAAYGAKRAEDRAIVRADLTGVEIAGARIRAGGEVLLLVATDQWRQVVPGQLVSTSGRAVPPRSGELLVAAVQVVRPPTEVAAAPGWQRFAEHLRDGLRTHAAQNLGPSAAGLLPGLVVGDTGRLPPEVVEEFKTAGLTHLTAVSGANLAIVCGAVLLVAHFVGAGPVISALAAGAALVGFVVLAGPEPSVLRAAVMGAIALLALVLGRERSALPALAASVIGLLLLSPGLATSAGFALSVAATTGLVLLAPSWSAALRARGVPAGLAEALAAPAAAHVLTAPLIAALSGAVSVVSVAANLLADPVVAPATVLGVLVTLSAPVAGWLAQLCTWLTAPELEWVLLVAHHASAVPGAEFDWPSGTTGGLLLAALTLVVLVVLRRTHIRWILAALVLVVGIALMPAPVLSRWPARNWSVIACDVGQGDGLVLSTGRPHEAVLVDTGPDSERMKECLRRLDVRQVPLAVLTHLHADHVGGLSSLLANSEVGAVAVGGLHEPKWAMREVVQSTRTRRIPLITLPAGQRLSWPGLVLDVLGPRGELARTTSSDDANDSSTVLKATTPAGRVLLTGDIELSGQGQLLSSGVDLTAEVLKVPHHGSRYTTPRFLAAVHPRWALISVGQGNSYGHPSPMLLGALTAQGTTVLRTDQQGDIAIVPAQHGARPVNRGDPIRKVS